MYVKVFFGTISAVVAAFITGFVYWLFSIISDLNRHLNGKPLDDPRPGYQQQVDSWLSFLPNNTLDRSLFVGGLLVAYIAITTFASLMALRAQRRRRSRAQQEEERKRAVCSYSWTRIAETVPRPTPYEQLRDIPIGGAAAQGKGSR